MKRKKTQRKHQQSPPGNEVFQRLPLTLKNRDFSVVGELLFEVLQALEKLAGQRRQSPGDHGVSRSAGAPLAVFLDNSINFGPIGGAGKLAPAGAGKDDAVEMARHYERLLAKKNQRIRDLENELEIFIPFREEWKEAV